MLVQLAEISIFGLPIGKWGKNIKITHPICDSKYTDCNLRRITTMGWENRMNE